MLSIIIFGQQGAGKGTQAKMLADKFNLEHIEPGRRLREFVERGGKMGKLVDSYINQRGKLVPTSFLINNVLKDWIKSLPKNKGVVCDGTPRRLREAKLLEKMLAANGRIIDYVFLVNISEEETYRRLNKRLTCRQCKKVWIEGVDVKLGEEVCPDDSGELYKRLDDQNKQAIKQRLEIYRLETVSSIDYFRNQAKVIDINGEQSIEKVHQDILAKIEKK